MNLNDIQAARADLFRLYDRSASTVSKASVLNSACAGYVAGVTGLVIGHPLDSAKVWLQTNTAGKNKHLSSTIESASISLSPRPSNTPTGSRDKTRSLKRPLPHATTGGTVSSMSTITTNTGGRGIRRTILPIIDSISIRSYLNTIRASYSGISGPLLTVGIVQSINFTTYDAFRRLLYSYEEKNGKSTEDYLKNDSLSHVAISGFLAGTGLAFLTSPLIMIKTRQQITGDGFRKSFRDTLLRKDGRLNLSGCFVGGFYPHFICETVGRALYYSIYEGSKRYIGSVKESRGLGTDVTLQERMASAGFAGVSCWVFIFPFDSLRNRMYNQGLVYAPSMLSNGSGNSPKLLCLSDMIRLMKKERSFYRGFWVTALRAGPVAATVLPVYDLMLEKLSAQ